MIRPTPQRNDAGAGDPAHYVIRVPALSNPSLPAAGERLSQKHAGAYYTPPDVAHALVAWAVRGDADRLLDPSCGDGRFIAAHPNSVGVDQDAVAAAQAAARAPSAAVYQADFFDWAASTTERFDCAVGNPPFIRYQTFKGAARARALALCTDHGVRFSGLTSSWAPFLVAAATRLIPGGRMAFVVPAEIGHAPYAAPLLEFLVAHFARVQVVAVRDKLFPDLSEDCWLLYADGYGGRTDYLTLTACDRFACMPRSPQSGTRVDVAEWRGVWNRRLRPYLIPQRARDAYATAVAYPGSARLGEFAAVGIGYVSGANDFFHLRPSTAERLGISPEFLRPTVRNGRALPAGVLTPEVVRAWQDADAPVLLLNLRRGQDLSDGVRRYLDSPAGQAARTAYKCRTRDPWYVVPDVRVPEYMLTYMAGRTASLVRNEAGATCTNAVHAVRVLDRARADALLPRWGSPLTQLSCEVEGHALGGGMLKLEPREAARVLLPAPAVASEDDTAVADGIAAMRRWRHYDA